MRFRFDCRVLDALGGACPKMGFGRRQVAATWLVEQGIERAKRAGDTLVLSAALPIYKVKNGDPTSKSKRMEFQLAEDDADYLRLLAIMNTCDAKTVALSLILDYLVENEMI